MLVLQFNQVFGLQSIISSMASSVRVRFAPSPTGPLHIGGVRTALYNYLFARHHNGTCILRIEDTDQTRYVARAEDYIIEALGWCGISFDEGPHLEGGPHLPYRQSERKDRYRQYAEQLLTGGHAYYAFDTAEELEAMRSRMEASGMKSPGYNYATRDHMKNSLAMPENEVQQYLDEGRPYVIRMKMPRQEDVRFEDLVRGNVKVNSSQLDDKVLLKSDGMPTYHLANVVDDHLMEITHVIRGEEWLPSTPLHVLMYRAFGWEMPQFAHLPLLLKPSGKGKLSKRDGDKHGFPVFPLLWSAEDGETVRGYREDGYLPEALVNFLGLLGWHPGGDTDEILSMAEMIEQFSLERVGKAGVKFNVEKLLHFNQHYIRERPDEDFLPEIERAAQHYGAEMPARESAVKLIQLLKDRVQLLPDFIAQSHYFFRRPEQYDEKAVKKKWKAEFLPVLEQITAAFTAVSQWDAQSLKQVVKSKTNEADVKLGKVMPMLRLGTTGEMAGPDVFEILEWLGKEEVTSRLTHSIATLAANE